jgi:plastocyanin domain-containing protein
MVLSPTAKSAARVRAGLVPLAAVLCASIAFAQEVSAPVKADADGVQRIIVTSGSYFFKPGRIVVRANVPVELLASRESGITPHNLVIQAPEAGVMVDQELASDPKKIAFTPTKPGKYAIYCSKKLPFMAGHREKGMEGVLEVVP